MQPEPIIGTGPNGEPVTARQAFAQAMAEAQEEWNFQADLADDDPRLKGFSDAGREAYLQARLIGHLATILALWPKIPKLEK